MITYEYINNKRYISVEDLEKWILSNGSRGKTLIDLDMELKGLASLDN